MNFLLDDEQKQIRDSVRRFLSGHYPFDVRTEYGRSGEPCPAIVEQLVAGSWIGVAICDELGGVGAGFTEACLIAEEFGRGLVVEPFWALSMAPTALLEGLSEPSAQSTLQGIAEGRSFAALGFKGEPQPGVRAESISPELFSLSGGPLRVYGSSVASHVLVIAAMDNNSARYGLFSLPVEQLSNELKQWEQLDGSRVGLLELNGLQLAKDCLISESADLLERYGRAESVALMGYCATALGMMEAVLSHTTDYLQVRTQFGVPIGRFQSLQHRLADMKNALEEARAITHRSLCFVDQSPEKFKVAVAEAKYLVGKSASFVAAQGVQLHGAIGLTDEFLISHYFRALTVFCQSFGTCSDHLQSLGNTISD